MIIHPVKSDEDHIAQLSEAEIGRHGNASVYGYVVQVESQFQFIVCECTDTFLFFSRITEVMRKLLMHHFLRHSTWSVFQSVVVTVDLMSDEFLHQCGRIQLITVHQRTFNHLKFALDASTGPSGKQNGWGCLE